MGQGVYPEYMRMYRESSTSPDSLKGLWVVSIDYTTTTSRPQCRSDATPYLQLDQTTSFYHGLRARQRDDKTLNPVGTIRPGRKEARRIPSTPVACHGESRWQIAHIFSALHRHGSLSDELDDDGC
jgi:hypothetical protein